jgi:hypothetical protein
MPLDRYNRTLLSNNITDPLVLDFIATTGDRGVVDFETLQQ